jgi:hypothetical protein
LKPLEFEERESQLEWREGMSQKQNTGRCEKPNTCNNINLLTKTPHTVQPPLLANPDKNLQAETHDILAPMVGKVMKRVYRGELTASILAKLDQEDPDVAYALRQLEYKNAEALIFETVESEYYVFVHLFECCEDVYIEDIQGDLEDLVGGPLLLAQEYTSETFQGPDSHDHKGFEVWTFYHFATHKGRVTVRWFGSSNGWYSMKVSLLQLHQDLLYHEYDTFA